MASAETYSTYSPDELGFQGLQIELGQTMPEFIGAKIHENQRKIVAAGLAGVLVLGLSHSEQKASAESPALPTNVPELVQNQPLSLVPDQAVASTASTSTSTMRRKGFTLSLTGPAVAKQNTLTTYTLTEKSNKDLNNLEVDITEGNNKPIVLKTAHLHKNHPLKRQVRLKLPALPATTGPESVPATSTDPAPSPAPATPSSVTPENAKQKVTMAAFLKKHLIYRKSQNLEYGTVSKAPNVPTPPAKHIPIIKTSGLHGLDLADERRDQAKIDKNCGPNPIWLTQAVGFSTHPKPKNKGNTSLSYEFVVSDKSPIGRGAIFTYHQENPYQVCAVFYVTRDKRQAVSLNLLKGSGQVSDPLGKVTNFSVLLDKK